MSAMSDYEWWKGGRTLLKAAETGDVDAVTAALDDGIDPNTSIAGGVTALMFAAWSGRIAAVRALLAKGADVNAQSDAGRTALMYAATAGFRDIVQALLDEGADVEVQNNNGWTALLDASSEGNRDVVKVLRRAAGSAATFVKQSTSSDRSEHEQTRKNEYAGGSTSSILGAESSR
jgi:ankyrin repeat protein